MENILPTKQPSRQAGAVQYYSNNSISSGTSTTTSAPRALAGATPPTAYAATIKTTPGRHPTDRHYRIRFDTVDQFGKLALRRAGKLHHLGIGKIHAHKPALIIVDHTTVTVIDHQTGEIFSEHDIDPTRNYWRNKQRSPGRWPGQTS